MFRRLRQYDFILSAYLLHTVIIYAAVAAALAYPENPYEYARHFTSIELFDALARWDSSYYLRLATVGYVRPDEAAFFPLYPLITGMVSKVLGLVTQRQGITVLAGLIVSNVSFVVGLYFFSKICAELYSVRIGKRAVLFLAIFPTSFYFSAVYTESLFFCFVMAALFAAHRSRWLLAGVFVGLASLTRNTGIVLVISLLIIYYKADPDVLRPKPRHLLPLGSMTVVPALMFSGWLYFLYEKYHDAMIFVSAQKYWGRHFAYPWQSLLRTFEVAPTEFLYTFVFVVLLVVSWKRIRFEHWVFMLLSLLILLSTVITSAGDALWAMPRYVLLMFPGFIYLAAVIRSRTVEMAYVTANVVFLIYLAGMFSRWYWVA